MPTFTARPKAPTSTIIIGGRVRFLPIKCSTERLQHLAYFAPWNILSTEALSFHSRHYFTGRAPWNTDSTKIELFTRNAIPQGEASFIRSSPHRAEPVLSKAEGTPRPQRKIFSYFSELGVLCPVEYRLDQDRVVRPKRYSTGRIIFYPIPKPKFNKKFQICLVRF
jgi:hypothetical protein